MGIRAKLLYMSARRQIFLGESPLHTVKSPNLPTPLSPVVGRFNRGKCSLKLKEIPFTVFKIFTRTTRISQRSHPQCPRIACMPYGTLLGLVIPSRHPPTFKTTYLKWFFLPRLIFLLLSRTYTNTAPFFHPTLSDCSIKTQFFRFCSKNISQDPRGIYIQIYIHPCFCTNTNLATFSFSPLNAIFMMKTYTCMSPVIVCSPGQLERQKFTLAYVKLS